jgi:hypothetical protein
VNISAKISKSNLKRLNTPNLPKKLLKDLPQVGSISKSKEESVSKETAASKKTATTSST